MTRLHTRILGALVLSLLCAVSVAADTVTSGFALLDAPRRTFLFNFAGSNFGFGGVGTVGSPPVLSLQPGQTTVYRLGLAGGDLGSGSATRGTTSVSPAFFSGTLGFLTAAFTLPNEPSPVGFTVSTSFALVNNSQIRVSDNPSRTVDLFTVMLEGSGAARFRLIPLGNDTFAVDNPQFFFGGTPPAESIVRPIPEPMTLVMFGTGLVGVVWKQRRRR